MTSASDETGAWRAKPRAEGSLATHWLSTGGRVFGVDSDGQRFLMLKADERAVAQTRVVLHWHEELKLLVPTR